MKLQIGTDQIDLDYSVAGVGEHSENVVQLRGQNGASCQYELTSIASTEPVVLMCQTKIAGVRQIYQPIGDDQERND